MQLTELQGDRTRIGVAHGEAHADKIQHSIVVYDQLFRDFIGIGWAEARREALRFGTMIERGFPAILEEMAGIAKGAGVETADILTLNCRSEISLTRASGGCSAFSLQRGGAQWLAQNWDWRSDQLHNVVALKIQGDDFAPLVSVGEAGMVAKIGMNAAGIGVCLNAIRSQTCGEGLPIHVALRKILESPDMASALAVASQDRVCSPAHFLMASGDGQAAGMEVHPGEPGRLEAHEGMVTHTNHLYAQAATCQVKDYPRADSGPRLERLNHLLYEELPSQDSVSEAQLFEILADHDGEPMSLCRHFNPEQPADERMETLFGIVMNLSERRLTLHHGKPCEPQERLTVRL